MYYVYVLKSQRNAKRYIGFTGKSVNVRLKEHNSGSSKFTSQNGPFELIYYEEYLDRSFAKKRERFLKTGHGRKFLKSKLKDL